MVAPSQIAGWMLSRTTLPRIQCIRLALVTVALAAAAILLLCHHCNPVSSSIEELSTMSAPVSFTNFVCCHCHDSGQAHIASEICLVNIATTFLALVGRQNCVFLAVARVRQLARVLGVSPWST
jgi:hypothetical protein